jgi:cytidyltransferase-like protein
MKRCFLLFTCFLLGLGAFIVPSHLSASILDENFDLEQFKGKKIGYYIGSFDPIHIGHQHVIDTALKEGHVDFILIYPAPGGDVFKNRSELFPRQRMIASVYQDNSKVILTYWTPKKLQEKFMQLEDEVEIVGIIGSDVITEKFFGPDKVLSEKYLKVFMRGIPLAEKHYEDTVGALMALKANSFLVALRGNIDLSYLNGYVHDRPIRAMIQSRDYSSTEVRNAIKEKRAFEKLLAFPVQAVIKEEGLYGYSISLNNNLKEELLEMQENDQKARERLIGVKNLSPKDWEEVAAIDTQNGKRLREIINEFGWPGVSLVGVEGTSAMWLLVQHQDLNIELQKECLELLHKAIQGYESPMRNYAYLLDRVNMNQKLPQVYGTQWVQEDGKYVLYQVEDMDNLDKRRFEAGLGSIAEYKEVIKQAYQLTDEDFK